MPTTDELNNNRATHFGRVVGRELVGAFSRQSVLGDGWRVDDSLRGESTARVGNMGAASSSLRQAKMVL